MTESSTILDDMGEHAERATILQSLGEVGGRKGVFSRQLHDFMLEE